MNRPDDEFDDFLTRRKPIFSRAAEDPLEPPDELDRVVLRQAREAIQAERPQRVYRGSRWGAPLAVAATLVIAFTVILNVGVPAKKDPVPEVTVQTVSQRVDYAEPAPPAPAANNTARAEADSTSDAVVVSLTPEPARSASPRAADSASPPAAAGGFVSEEEASRYASTQTPARSPAAPRVGVVVEDKVTASPSVVTYAPPPTEAQRAMAKATAAPAFRRDSHSWLAEIERLRAAGESVQADAEMLEYKRQHRAYAVAPDR